ncbi:MAG: hypothetical protein AMS24_01835 [Chlamydiae bacterium SM23_39]|nr:MAG: hypothetical protein AMS24_01835 [Chlamydiae bacterium SM23_39]
MYFESIIPTPVFNTFFIKEIFGKEEGNSLDLDKKGHMRSLEYIALKGTIFMVTKVFKTFFKHKIYQVIIKEYPSNKNLYIDSRFVRPSFKKNKNEFLKINKTTLIDRLEERVGKNYFWGGNISEGIKEMLYFYPPKKNIKKKLKDKWILKGLDCSGLLYEITNGYTPRNTSWMMYENFGKVLDFEKLKINEIKTRLKPLDVILYIRHVIVILDSNCVIESREGKGVIKIALSDRLEEILRDKKLTNTVIKNEKEFIIKRWLF